MSSPVLRMCFADRETLDRELASNLRLGRAFVLEATGVEVLSDCTLVLVHPEDGAEHAISAQAVLVSDAEPMRGVGLALRPFDAQVVSALEAFVRGERPDQSGETDAVAEAAAAEPEARATEPEASAPENAEQKPEARPDEDDTQAQDEAEAEPSSEVQSQQVRHERLRKLNQTQQQRLARSGDLNDRVVLERLFGKNVWDSLLHNPKLTVPEVARIARKGTVPRPLLELIAENNTWIQAPMVRRALLGNPRVSSEAIMKLLRITPKHELRVIHKTTTYSAQVREAARKVLEL